MALYERNTAHEERAIAIQVLTMESGRIRRVDGFVGKSVFPAFGLPVTRRY
jgi:hypothetical protein